MSKHTPGPWTLGQDADCNPCASVEAVDCTGFVIAHTTRIEMGHRLRGVTGEQMANARLIAAAPDMLEFAEWAFKNATDRSTVERARTVIAKATGKAS